MKVTIDLDKLDFIEKEMNEKLDGVNEVTLSCGTAKATYASNKSIEDCTTYAFRLLIKSLIENNVIECNNCQRVFKDQQAYNRFIAGSFNAI